MLKKYNFKTQKDKKTGNSSINFWPNIIMTMSIACSIQEKDMKQNVELYFAEEY